MSDLYGQKALKFKVGSTEIYLYHAVPEAPLVVPREIEKESKINAHREWKQISAYDHLDVMVRVNLFDYDDARAKFAQLMAYNHTEVDELYMSIDKAPLKNSSDVAVKFHIMYIQSIFLQDPKIADVLRILFRSQDPVDLTKSLYTELVDDLGAGITDDLDAGITDG